MHLGVHVTKLMTDLTASANQRLCHFQIYSFPKRQILDTSKLKRLAEDNFKFDVNGRQFLKWVEYKVGKGEISHYEQILLFPQCFQITYTADTYKNLGFFGKGLKNLGEKVRSV